ncbi:MAG: hypothetical protein A2066_20335 [Bacteroidetes bacterium GWB2_41_8]|nr:MAG: hypothetical protein A2066_20335 [Bacteroidetes bacterium GWB2_41_8]
MNRKQLTLYLFNTNLMKNIELKNSIYQKIDRLDNNELNEINGMILNYINKKDDLEEWNTLTEQQQAGIYQAIDSLEKGEGILHEDLMNKYRSKYSRE